MDPVELVAIKDIARTGTIRIEIETSLPVNGLISQSTSRFGVSANANKKLFFVPLLMGVPGCE